MEQARSTFLTGDGAGRMSRTLGAAGVAVSAQLYLEFSVRIPLPDAQTPALGAALALLDDPGMRWGHNAGSGEERLPAGGTLDVRRLAAAVYAALQGSGELDGIHADAEAGRDMDGALSNYLGVATRSRPGEGTLVYAMRHGKPGTAAKVVTALLEHYDLEPVAFQWTAQGADPTEAGTFRSGTVFCAAGCAPRFQHAQDSIDDIAAK